MPPPLGSSNRLEHGCRATHPNAEHAPNRVESGEIETDYRYGIPALPRPLTQAHSLACKFRRDLVQVVSDVHGDRAVWIAERVVKKGRLKGMKKLVRRIAPAFAKLIHTATVAYRSCYAAGIISRKMIEQGDYKAFGEWQDRELKYANDCDRKLDTLGVLKLIGPADPWQTIHHVNGQAATRDATSTGVHQATEAADAADSRTGDDSNNGR